jgi:hypothetical protein
MDKLWQILTVLLVDATKTSVLVMTFARAVEHEWNYQTTHQ